MSVIPEDFIQNEIARLDSLVNLLVNYEAKSKDDRDAVGIAGNVQILIPSFEIIRAAAKAELDAGGLTSATGAQYHAQIDEIQDGIMSGFLLVAPKTAIDPGSYAEKWLWAVQLSFGIHYISHVRSGSMGAGSTGGPVILGHGGKSCIPPHEC